MNLASIIDHTLLKSDVTSEQIIQLCSEAKDHQFFGVCVNSAWISLCKSQLKSTSVKVVSVVGFPLGACLTEVKVFEAQKAIDAGADEIDMVLNIGELKMGHFDFVEKDIHSVVTAAKSVPVKVILETHLLSESEKKKACELSCKAGAAFVKTSTGFTGGGATLEDVRLMKSVVGTKVRVKASGGVKTKEQALAMIEAGAERIGTSSGVAIVSGKIASPGGY